MKKRLKGLLALTLALSLVLGMTTGIASALEVSDSLSDDQIVDAGELLVAGSGGYLVVYKDGELVSKGHDLYEKETDVNGNTEYKITDRACIITSVANASQDDDGNSLGSDYESTGYLVPENDKQGYVKDKWNIDGKGFGQLYVKGRYNHTTQKYGYHAGTTMAGYLTGILINYTIIYDDGNGKKVQDDNQKFTVENMAGKTILGTDDDALSFTKEDGEFTGWKLRDGSMVDTGDFVADVIDTLINNAVVDLADPAKATITLTAQWAEVKNFEVEYDGAGGKDEFGSSSVISGYSIDDLNMTDENVPSSASAELFEYAGKSFVEWNTQADGKGQSYSADATMSQEFINQAIEKGKITLYAIWEDDSGEGPGQTEDDDNADTGDDSNMLPWATLATAALLASLGLVLTARRKKA